MMRTVRASTASTMTATTPTTIQAIIQAPLFIDERCCARNLCDLDLHARLEHLVGHVSAGRPVLAADADETSAGVDALQHHGVCADERRRAGANRMRHAEMP